MPLAVIRLTRLTLWIALLGGAPAAWSASDSTVDRVIQVYETTRPENIPGAIRRLFFNYRRSAIKEATARYLERTGCDGGEPSRMAAIVWAKLHDQTNGDDDRDDLYDLLEHPSDRVKAAAADLVRIRFGAKNNCWRVDSGRYETLDERQRAIVVRALLDSTDDWDPNLRYSKSSDTTALILQKMGDEDYVSEVLEDYLDQKNEHVAGNRAAALAYVNLAVAREQSLRPLVRFLRAKNVPTYLAAVKTLRSALAREALAWFTPNFSTLREAPLEERLLVLDHLLLTTRAEFSLGPTVTALLILQLGTIDELGTSLAAGGGNVYAERARDIALRLLQLPEGPARCLAAPVMAAIEKRRRP